MLTGLSHRLFMNLLLTVKALISPVTLGATALVEDENGRILLARHSYLPGWSLPGGGVARGEAPDVAVMRELAEEVGLTGGQAELFGIYSRRAGWVTNVILVYRVTGAAIAFTPNWEVRAVCFADPKAPPPETTDATRRRLAELLGAPRSPRW